MAANQYFREGEITKVEMTKFEIIFDLYHLITLNIEVQKKFGTLSFFELVTNKNLGLSNNELCILTSSNYIFGILVEFLF